MIKLHPRHLNGLYCRRGARAWCARHNINYREFVLYGIDVEVLEAVGDAFAIEVCAIARKEHAQQEVKNG